MKGSDCAWFDIPVVIAFHAMFVEYWRLTGIIADDAIDAAELPFILVATTVNVYDVPFVRP